MQSGCLRGIEPPVRLQACVVVRLRLGIGGLHLGGDPGFDGRAAHRRVDEADRHTDLLVNLATEEIQHRREAADGVRRACLPGTFALGLWLLSRAGAFAIVADQRELRRRLFRIEVVTTRDCHRHV